MYIKEQKQIYQLENKFLHYSVLNQYYAINEISLTLWKQTALVITDVGTWVGITTAAAVAILVSYCDNTVFKETDFNIF